MSKNSVILVDLGVPHVSSSIQERCHLIVNHEIANSSHSFDKLFILSSKIAKTLGVIPETVFDVKDINQMMKKYIDPKPYEISLTVADYLGDIRLQKELSQGRNYEEAVVAFLESKPESMIVTSIAETHEATGESLSSPILRIKGDWVVVNRTWLTVGACSILIDQDKVEVYSVNQEDGGDMGNISLDHQYALQASDELNEPSV